MGRRKKSEVEPVVEVAPPVVEKKSIAGNKPLMFDGVCVGCLKRTAGDAVLDNETRRLYHRACWAARVI